MDIQNAVQSATGMFNQLKQNLGGAFSQLGSDVHSVVNTAGQDLGNFQNQAIQNIGDPIRQDISPVSQFIQKGIQNTISNLGGAVGNQPIINNYTPFKFDFPTINQTAQTLFPNSAISAFTGGQANQIIPSLQNTLQRQSDTMKRFAQGQLTPEEQNTFAQFMIPGGMELKAGETALARAGEQALSPEVIQRIAGDINPDYLQGVIQRASSLKNELTNMFQNVVKGGGEFAQQAKPVNLLKDDFIGNRNLRIGETNQLALQIEKLLPKEADQQAVTFYRELKNNPSKASLIEDSPYSALVNRALNPTPQMIQADQLLESYFKNRSLEGNRLGYLKNDLSDYINRIYEKGDETEHLGGLMPRSPMSRTTPFGQGRTYDTIFDAIANGKTPATLKATDLLRIYGERDAVANSTAKFLQSAKDAELGGWFHPNETPANWTSLDPYGKKFENTIPFIGKDGEAALTRQVFAVPQQLANMMKPVLEPDWLKRVGGIGKWRWAQSWAKYINLSVSFFHAKALTLVAGNSNPLVIAKAAITDMQSPAFKQAELDLLRDGGTTSMLGGEYNAYRNIYHKGNLLTDNPLTRAFNALANKTTGVTFDTLQRKYKVLDYSFKKAGWLASHPNATPEEVKVMGSKFANYVNSAYGGLNWEKMGLSKSALTTLRMFLLAPDWTFSNFMLPIQSIRGTAPALQSMRFVAASFATGIALTQLTNMLLNGKPSNDPFNVTLGYRKDGTEVKSNSFFAGDAKDLVSLFQKGPIEFIASKLAPFDKTIAEELLNRDQFGNQIRIAGKGIAKNTLATAENLAGGLPIPFGISNPLQLLRGAQRSGSQPLPSELLLAATGMGQITTKNPAKEAYKQAFNQAISQGKGDLSSQLTGLTLQKKVKELQQQLMQQGVSGAGINQSANQLAQHLENVNKAKEEVKKSGQGQLIDGTYVFNKNGQIKTLEVNKDIPKPQLTGQPEVDKELNKQYATSLSGRIRDLAYLASVGVLTPQDANSQITALKQERQSLGLQRGGSSGVRGRLSIRGGGGVKVAKAKTSSVRISKTPSLGKVASAARIKGARTARIKPVNTSAIARVSVPKMPKVRLQQFREPPLTRVNLRNRRRTTPNLARFATI